MNLRLPSVAMTSLATFCASSFFASAAPLLSMSLDFQTRTVGEPDWATMAARAIAGRKRFINTPQKGTATFTGAGDGPPVNVTVPLVMSDAVDLDERAVRERRHGDGGPDGRLRTEPVDVGLVHPFEVLDVGEVDVHPQHPVHRRACDLQ